MFVFFSKLLPIFVYPASLAAILLLIALRVRRSKLRSGLIGAAAALLWLLGNTWVSSTLVRSLEWRYLPQTDDPPAEAIVILGGATQPADYPRPTVEISGGGDRILYGAHLYREGRAPVVVLTGGNLPWAESRTTPAGEMLTLLTGMGVPADAVLLEEESDNTYENAVFSRRLLAPLGYDRILLVTSAMHMPRAVRVFENQGFSVIPAPTDFLATRPDTVRPIYETWPDALLSVFPSAFALAESTAALKEYVGIAVYALRGWY